MVVVAIIPARGGSKSIPRKNIKMLGGKPLIAYSIETALESEMVDRVIVSTDDSEIAEVAKKYGAEVPFIRPKELAQDNTPMLPVLQHAIKFLEGKEKLKVDYIVLLDPTTPFRTVEDMDACIKKIKETNADSVDSVCEYEHNPYFNGMLIKEKDKLVPLNKKHNRAGTRQEVPIVYRENAAVLVVKRDVLMKKNKLFTDNMRGVVMTQENSVNIDTPIDWEYAEFVMEKRRAENGKK